MKFDMSREDNFASFFDAEKEKHIFVESFDNETFEVLIGTVEDSASVGSFVASNDEELNSKIMELYNKHIGGR
ncbi:hypothetical protein MSP8887_03861 [Marinomonas spartinae]|uniref:Uncharacterized protein n=1 Tax=Marinomonas spartinae TaxID=1792290 RepID=A0A1A8TKN5_9GAMM|nr:hypothetical protein [Marinomonas spartinae]SBS33527.1 hypothetical protein MSP8886_02781 [Marinomonas spartinae]SBS39518.1 hypothetical protein MSP8887_03861 [Marinomonas spartinae]